jgi:hypothetical protein
MTFGELVERAQAVMRSTDADDLKHIKQAFNAAYFRIAELAPWHDMLRQVEHTFTASETDGRYLRSDMIGITDVVDETDGQEVKYHETSEDKRFSLDGRKHWFHPAVDVTPTDEIARGISVTRGHSSISGSSSLSGNQSGEYFQFEDRPGFYKFTSTSAFTPVFWGDTVKSKGIVVRPRRTKKLVIVDEEGDLEGATVKVYMWVYPVPLHLDAQTPLIPHVRALELMTWIDLMGPLEKKRAEAQDYRNELYGPDRTGGVLAQLMAMNRSPVKPVLPRGSTGTILKFGRRR